jgi:hypothetical protein
MKFPKFPVIEGYPCTDPDMYWGYACDEHVSLGDFRRECCRQYAHGERKFPFHVPDDRYPCHAFVRWEGFGGWTFCFPDQASAKAITIWPADGCTYTEWLFQMLKDICDRPSFSDADDEKALRIVHTLQQFRNDGYIPALDAMYIVECRADLLERSKS